MNWNNIFKNEVTKPTTVYESTLFEEYLESKRLKETSKTTYRTYRDRFVEWLKKESVTTLEAKHIEKWLSDMTEKVNPRQAYARWSLFRDYINWLIIKGKMSVNVWDSVDLVLCGCDKDTARAYEREEKKKRKEERAEPSMVGEKRFTLSDVALLLIAIEENDEEAILSVLNK